MEKSQPAGVQGLSLQEYRFIGRIAANFAPRDAASSAIVPVAKNGATDVVQDGRGFDAFAPSWAVAARPRSRRIVPTLRRKSVPDGFQGWPRMNGHLLADPRMKPDRAVDEVAIAGRMAGNQAQNIPSRSTGTQIAWRVWNGPDRFEPQGSRRLCRGRAGGRCRDGSIRRWCSTWDRNEIAARLANVPDQCPRAGWTTMPGGLLTTTRCSS